MRWTIAGLVFVGLIAAVSAAVLAVTLRTDIGLGTGSQESDEVEVMVAARALPAMTMVDSSAIARETVKRSNLLPKAVTNSSQIIGRVLLVPVLAGQQFTTAQFASSDSGLQLAAAIPEGHRAMSIMLSDETGIEDLLYPGSIVDVVASFRLPSVSGGSSAEVVSVTLLQGIQVLKVGDRSIIAPERSEVKESERRGRMITLMVNTAQAEALQLATTHGTVSVSLRNPLDTALTNVAGTRISDLSKDLAERIRRLTEQEVGAMPLTPPELSQIVGAASGGGTSGSGATATPTGASPTSGSATMASAMPPQAPIWVTTVYRGRVKEVQKFTLPEEQEAH